MKENRHYTMIKSECECKYSDYQEKLSSVNSSEQQYTFIALSKSYITTRRTHTIVHFLQLTSMTHIIAVNIRSKMPA